MATFFAKYGIGDDVSFPSRRPATLGKLIPAKVAALRIDVSEGGQEVSYSLVRIDNPTSTLIRRECEVHPGILLPSVEACAASATEGLA